MLLTIKAPGSGATILATVLPVGVNRVKFAADLIRDVARRMGVSHFALDFSIGAA